MAFQSDAFENDAFQMEGEIDLIDAMSTTANFNVTRNQVIEAALRKIGAFRLGATMNAAQLAQGIQALNLIIREEDAKGTGQAKNLWALDEKTLQLQADGFVYDVDNDGLSGSILDIVSAYYRNTSGDDTPLKIYTTEEYDAIADKDTQGDPEIVYLKRNVDLSCQMFYVWPAKSSVGTTSEVIGSDGVNYRCITGHTSDAIRKPITGTSYRIYWQEGGEDGSAWVDDTDYTNGELIRYVIKRPLYDFTSAGDNPDMPQGWSLYLIYRLALDLSPEYHITLEERNWLMARYKEARSEIFPNSQPISNNFHSKGQYF